MKTCELALVSSTILEICSIYQKQKPKIQAAIFNRNRNAGKSLPYVGVRGRGREDRAWG